MARQFETGEEYTLEIYPPTVWAAATVRLRDTAGADIVPVTSAVVSTDARAIASGARGGDHFVLTAGAPALVVGRPYLLEVGGATQEIVPSFVAGDDVTVMQRLRYAPAGGVVRDHRVTYTATAPAEIQRAVRVTWRSSAGDVQRSTIDFVRQPFFLGVTSRDVDAIGTLFGTLGDDYGVFELLLGTAQDDIDAALRGRGVAPDLVIERALLERAAVYRVAALRAREPAMHARYQEEYQRALGDFFASKAWVDLSSSDTQSRGDRPPPYYAGLA